MDGIEQAAQVFSGNTPEVSSGPVEEMFGNLGILDEDSPAAGGDDMPDRPAKASKKAPAQSFEDDEGEHNVDPEADEEAEPEADEEAEPEADEEADDADDPVYEVTVDGERKEVSLREALDGYIRQETFHQRLNELNTYRDGLASHANKILEQRQEYASKLEKAEKLISVLIPAEPNWVEEYSRDPVGAAAMQKNYNELKAVLDHIGKEKGAVQETDAKEDAEARKAYIERENARIFNNIPQWKDEKIRARDLQRMAETATKAGFSNEEVVGTVDSRMITILHKAAKYDALQANKPKPIPRSGPKPVKPGAGSKSTAPKGLSQASNQLRRTGSLEDAASVMANLISPRRK